MARLKVEALAHRHRARGIPLEARIAGHAHDLLAAGSRVPRLAALAARAVARAGGDAPPVPVRQWRAARRARGGDGDVVLMADTFTRYLDPGIGEAALRVLGACGARVDVVDPGCCGRPLLSQGLVGPARARARRALDRLAPHAIAGRRIVVLEPSCWSMLVDDLPRLVPGDPRARWVADAAVTFERAVAELGPPPLREESGDPVAHEHCHARALGGGREGAAALAAIPGLAIRDSGAGCCGMAGAFGYRHGDMSRAHRRGPSRPRRPLGHRRRGRGHLLPRPDLPHDRPPRAAPGRAPRGEARVRRRIALGAAAVLASLAVAGPASAARPGFIIAPSAFPGDVDTARTLLVQSRSGLPRRLAGAPRHRLRAAARRADDEAAPARRPPRDGRADPAGERLVVLARPRLARAAGSSRAFPTASWPPTGAAAASRSTRSRPPGAGRT